VEDDKTVREGLAELLSDWGCLLEAAVARDDALSLAAQLERRPDLIITDLRLPGMSSGIELGVELRQAFGAEIPVLVVTGDTTQSADLRPLGSATTLITKPVNPDYLLSVIEGLVARSRRPLSEEAA
jgi:CheY-like chemotaxis protein